MHSIDELTRANIRPNVGREVRRLGQQRLNILLIVQDEVPAVDRLRAVLQRRQPVQRAVLLAHDQARVAELLAADQQRRDQVMRALLRIARRRLVGEQALLRRRIRRLVKPHDYDMHVRLAARF